MTKSGLLVVVLLGLFFGMGSQAEAATLLVREDRYGNYGYGGSPWDNMTAEINTAFGGAGNVTVVADFESETLTDYDAVWIDVGGRDADGEAQYSLSATEESKIDAFIDTGKRVVMIGENSAWENWNNEILGVVGDSYSGSFSATITTSYSHDLTDSVSSVKSVWGGEPVNGTSLFSRKVATLWEASENVLVFMDVNLWDDTYWSNNDNAQFAQNVASWIAEPTNAAPTITAPTSITQATDGTGYISFETTLTDTNGDTSVVKVEYSDDGGTTWYDPDLVSASGDGTPTVDDAETYQVESVTSTTDGNTLTITWDTLSADNGNGTLDSTDQSDIQIRVTPNDGTVDGTVQTSASFSLDNVDPVASTLSPADDATAVAVDNNLVITFDVAVDAESGNVTIYKASDGSVIEAVDVSGSLVTGTGTTQITINPTNNLANDNSYYVLIDATAFDDAVGNSYAGIGDATTWNFKTVAGGGGEPAPVQSDPEPMPDPVTNVDSDDGGGSSGSSGGAVQDIETKPAEVYDLRVKAPDYDQVKTVTIKINGQTHTLKLDRSDGGNPSFIKDLKILEAGKYPYLITIDYGTTNRHIKGVYVVKETTEKKEPIPMAPAAVMAGPGTRQYVPPVTQEEGAEQPQQTEQPKKEVAKPAPIAMPELEPSEEAEGEEGSSFFKTIAGSVGGFSRGLVGKMSSGTKKVAQVLGDVRGALQNLSGSLVARVASFKIAMPSTQKHIYDKVTIKLASAEGKALAGAAVTMYSEPKVAITDEEGRAEFYGVESGKHKLVINYNDYTSKQSVYLDQEVEEVTIHITAEFKKDRGWW